MKYLLAVVVLLPVLVVGGLLYLGQQSQSGEPAGIVGGQLAQCPDSPNCASSENNTPEEKRVEPLPLTAWDKLPAAIARMGGSVTRQGESYLAAEFTSSLFRFVDDVEFRRSEEAVHMRSASRVGYSDRGVNSDRLATLRTAIAN